MNKQMAEQATKQSRDRQFQNIWAEALGAGSNALANCKPIPMIVQEHQNMWNDNSPVTKQWFVGAGACGFAWVKIRPATSSFAKWLLANGYAKTDRYEGGLSYWVSQGGQSLERKEAFARAMAAILREHEINAHPRSRLD